MNKKIDKLVKEQQTNINKSIGLGYQERQKFAHKAGQAENSMNDLLATLGVKNFLEFMQTYAVDPAGAGHMRDVDMGTMNVVDSDTGESRTVAKRGKELDLDSSKTSGTNNAITFGEYSAATKKIAYARLEKATDSGGKFRLAVETIAKAHSFPIYYLPWASNKVLRLTIPPMGIAPIGLPDPDIFFTAGINGCSVFIEGTQQNPTIYHGGTEDKMNTNSGKFWRNLYREWSATAAAEEKGAKTFGEVKKSQYIKGSGKETDARFQDTTRTGVDYEGWIKNNQKDVDVTIVQPWGCVFGLRDSGGDWTFYLQKNAVVKYYSFKKSGLFGTGKRKRSGVEKSYNLPLQLMKVFPGHAHVRITDFVKVREGY